MEYKASCYCALTFQTPFYIVTHGGPRDVMLSLNAVVSLLDEEGIIPTKICGTNLATKMIEQRDRKSVV